MSSHFIRLQEASCHNCMRCVRACPTNAMTYMNNQPTIIEQECILCGNCYSVCPHDAKEVLSEMKLVRRWLDEKQEVILSVAPSFVSVWPQFSALQNILINRGFSGVDETARGAKLTSQAYVNLIEKGEMENIITTCCPAVVSLIEKEYGDQIGLLAPVVSPMIAHGRLLKKEHPNAKVVFLSPCIAKIKEIDDPRFKGSIDACISMEEVFLWLKGDLKEEEKEDWKNFEGSVARLYPTPGGIIATLPRDTGYKYVNVEGIDRIKDVLSTLRDNHLKGYFFEMSACRESCLGGPLLAHFKHNEWLGQSIIRENVNREEKVSGGPLPVDMEAVWKKENIYRPSHTEEEIQEEMLAMGKTSEEKIHDCGACGYETCRLKAIAVLDGKADPKICLPEALAQAQSLSNVVIENTPNGIIVMDDKLNIREMNPSARAMLNMEMTNPTGMPLEAALPSDELINMINGLGTKTGYIRIFYDTYKKLIYHAIVKIPNEPYIVLILMDRTEEETKEQMMKQMRSQTMEVTQEVIDDQMRTVQEIASLLGETAAKSKVALTRLKKAMDSDEQ